MSAKPSGRPSYDELVRGVLVCGPLNWTDCDGEYEGSSCPFCDAEGRGSLIRLDGYNHAPDCLWLRCKAVRDGKG